MRIFACSSAFAGVTFLSYIARTLTSGASADPSFWVLTISDFGDRQIPISTCRRNAKEVKGEHWNKTRRAIFLRVEKNFCLSMQTLEARTPHSLQRLK